MDTSTKVVLGTLAGCGALLAGEAAAQGTVCQPPEGQFLFEYGPRDATGVAVGAQIADVIATFGSPYRTFPSGRNTVYLYGHGVHAKNPEGQGVIKHDELLVTATPAGRVVAVSYHNKFTLCGDFATILDNAH
jgi:hypothetical protein